MPGELILLIFYSAIWQVVCKLPAPWLPWVQIRGRVLSAALVVALDGRPADGKWVRRLHGNLVADKPWRVIADELPMPKDLPQEWRWGLLYALGGEVGRALRQYIRRHPTAPRGLPARVVGSVRTQGPDLLISVTLEDKKPRTPDLEVRFLA